jgi:maltose-binding protein MalE
MACSWIRIIALGLLLCLVGSACKGDKDKKNDRQNPTAQPIAQATPILPFTVRLTLWHSFTEPLAAGLQALADRLNAANSSITLSLEYHAAEILWADYEQALRTGGGPDLLVIEQEWLAEMADKELILPVDRTLIPEFEESLPFPLYSSLFYRQQLWGVPVEADVLVMYVNTSKIAHAPQSFNELVALADPVLVYPGVEGTVGLYHGPTGYLVDDDGQPVFLKEAMIDYLRHYQRLATAPSTVFTDNIAQFSDGDAVVLIAYASEYATLQEALGNQLLVAALPEIDGALWRPLVRISPLVISQNATDTTVRGAQLLFTYLVSAESQTLMAEAANRTPPITADPAALDGVKHVIWEQIQLARPWSPYPVLMSRVFPALETALNDAQAENADLPAVADAFLAEIRRP